MLIPYDRFPSLTPLLLCLFFFRLRQIQSLESRLKYSEIDLTTGNKKVSENEKKIRAMEAELNKNKPKMDELQKTLDEKVNRQQRA